MTGVTPRFYIEPREDKPASLEAGHPKFKDVEFVEVIIAGDKNNRPVFKVRDEHRQRWPDQYKAFKGNQEQEVEGFRVEEWPGITRAKAEELKALGIFTVEALADLPDSSIHRLGMGARALMAKAKAYLENSENGAELAALAERLSCLEAENELLKETVGIDLVKENLELKEQIEKLKAPKRKRRTKAEMEAARAK